MGEKERIVAQSSVWNLELLNRYRQEGALESASVLSTKDDRDIVMPAVGTAYFHVVASEARLATAQAALTPAQELNAQVTSQSNSGVSLEIDMLRARVELRTANYNQVYAIEGTISVPLFTSGRIRSDEHAAEATLVQRRSAYQDIQGRAEYDIRVARLDAESSESAVRVAAENKTLATRALTQSQDRFSNGVTNRLEVLRGAHLPTDEPSLPVRRSTVAKQAKTAFGLATISSIGHS
jgi:outer membrane protein TolC